MNVSEALSKGRAVLANGLEAQVLLAFAMKKSKEFCFAHPEFRLASASLKKYRVAVAKRSQGVPVAYLTGHREFFGLDFFVTPAVLIPRPETELVVELALEQLGSKNMTLCDVGTGSGCIAVTLAKKRPDINVVAVDISPRALQVARKNARLHDVQDRVELLQSDLLSKITTRHFDGLVANLPYIGKSENHLVEREVVEHEPSEALFAGETGLELFEKLFAQIALMNPPPRWLIAEMGFSQKPALQKLIKKYFGNKHVVWKNDLAGLPRCFVLIL